MEIFENNKKIFIGLGVVAVLVIVYLSFFRGDSAVTSSTPSGSLVSVVSEPGAGAYDLGPQLIILLNRLQGIRLDYSVFEDPVFLALTDQSRPLEPQPLGKTQGRVNPFSDFSGTPSVQPTAQTGQTGVNGSRISR